MAASVELFEAVLKHVAVELSDPRKDIDDYSQWTDHHGDNPLHHICRRRNENDIIELLRTLLLRKDKARVHERVLSDPNFEGFSPLDYLSPDIKVGAP